MSKILLYFPKLEYHKKFHYFPISALAVASHLLSQGHEVRIYDQRIKNKFSLYHEVKTTKKIMISAYTGHQLSEAYKFAKATKLMFPEKKIIVGGPHATVLPEQTLASPYVDEVVCGDVDTGEHPLPYWLIDIKKYINPETERFAYVSSYGCIGNCTFCQTTPRRKLLFLPPERIEKDIHYLMSHYPFRQAVFFDATLFTKPGRASFVAQLMKKYKLQFICNSRADEICKMPKIMLDEIINSGLVQVTVGLESGSPRIVQLMKKGKDYLKNFKQCAQILSRYSVKMCSGVIFGTPGEDVEDIKLTIDYIKKIKLINPNFFISTTFYMPLPMTEMCNDAIKYGYIEPKSLKEYAERGADMHYKYNSYQSSLWIKNPEEYHKIYNNFVEENADLFI